MMTTTGSSHATLPAIPEDTKQSDLILKPAKMKKKSKAEKKVKAVDEFGNQIKETKKKTKKKKKVQETTEQQDNSLHQGLYNETNDAFPENPFPQDPFNHSGGDFSGSFSCGSDSISTIGNMSAAEVARQNNAQQAQAQAQAQANDWFPQQQQHQQQQLQQQNTLHDNDDKFEMFAQDFDGHRPRSDKGAKIDKMRMFADSFQVTASQFAEQYEVGECSQSSEEESTSESILKSEIHAVLVQYVIAAGGDPLLAEEIAYQFEEQQLQQIESLGGTVTMHDFYEGVSFLQETSMPQHLQDDPQLVSTHFAADIPPATAGTLLEPTAHAYGSSRTLATDAQSIDSRALLLQFLASVGTDASVAERMVDDFAAMQSGALPLQQRDPLDEQNRVEKIKAMNMEHFQTSSQSRKRTTQPDALRRPRPDTRAFGTARCTEVTRKPRNKKYRSMEGDTEIVDLEAGNEEFIQAVPVSEKGEFTNEIVYAEPSTFGIKHAICDTSVGRLFLLLCLVVFGIIVAVTVVVLQKPKAVGDSIATNVVTATISPSSAPTYISDDVEKAAISISGSASVLDSASPQRKAVSWLSSKDEVDPEGFGIQFFQRYIMVVLYFATNEEHWLEKDDWLSPKLHVCDWSYGIICGTDLSQRDIITGIDLTRYGLSGSIPVEVGLLENLNLLRLSINSLNGTIPEMLTNLTKLTTLDLSTNQLSGSIPGRIGDLQSLNFLKLSGNELIGTIPPSLLDLILLKNLDLSLNNLTGELSQNITNLQSLGTLHLKNNQFHGQVPSFANMRYLQFIWLDYNQFSGSFGSIAGDVIYRQEFTISHNRILGPIPKGSANLSFSDFNIQRVDISYNQLTGTLPVNLQFIHSIRYLDVSGNAFTGQIPAQESLNGWQGLEYFGAAGNQLTGTIALGFSASLRSLDLSGNLLTGGIPPELFTRFPNLNHVGLSNNSLGGPLSGSIGNLLSLGDLHLSNCSLTGVLPDTINDLTNLENLMLNHNTFTGTIPSSLGSLTLLRTLALEHNFLSGSLPFEVGSLTSLTDLNVAFNNLNGMLPMSLGFLSGLEIFVVSGNDFTGGIPDGVCDHVELSQAMVGCDLECSCCTDVDACALDIFGNTR